MPQPVPTSEEFSGLVHQHLTLVHRVETMAHELAAVRAALDQVLAAVRHSAAEPSPPAAAGG